MNGQLSLTDLPTGPTARRTDPDTAKAAGAGQTPIKLTRGRELVLRALAANPDGLSDFDYLDVVGLIQTSAGKRRVELERAGLVELADWRAISPAGSPVRVYRLTDAGRDLAGRLR